MLFDAATAALFYAIADRLAVIVALFGDPRALAQRLWLGRALARRLSRLLRPVERLLRLALMRMARTLPPAPLIERKHRAKLGMGANSGALFDPDHPETWRVALVLRAPAKQNRRAAKTSVRGIRPPLSSAPLALRLEALLRALADPIACARRLARATGVLRAQGAAHASLLGAQDAPAGARACASFAAAAPPFADSG